MAPLLTIERLVSMFSRFPEKLAPFAPTVLRIMVGITFFFNGLPKLQNIAGNVKFLAGLGVPAPELFGPLVAIMETFGGILLILGLGTRFFSLYYVGEMTIT
jgi:putative oxidoreductase